MDKHDESCIKKLPPPHPNPHTNKNVMLVEDGLDRDIGPCCKVLFRSRFYGYF